MAHQHWCTLKSGLCWDKVLNKVFKKKKRMERFTGWRNTFVGKNVECLNLWLRGCQETGTVKKQTFTVSFIRQLCEQVSFSHPRIDWSLSVWIKSLHPLLKNTRMGWRSKKQFLTQLENTLFGPLTLACCGKTQGVKTLNSCHRDLIFENVQILCGFRLSKQNSFLLLL